MIQELYQRAMKFAGEKHSEQKVTGTNSNYLLHISNVAMEVIVAYYEDDDFDATDNIISRKRNRRKPPDAGVLIDRDESDECMEADSEDNEKSKCV